MDKEYLDDYFTKEKEEIGRFLGDLLRIDSHSSYPDKSRFRKLKEPIGMANTKYSIWSQIPLVGSLIIQIAPLQEDIFYKFHGDIEKRDFERLIDFCKDTGKVQFTLNGDPKLFEGLDFLDPLFEELHPPISYNTPLRYKIESKKLYNYHIEFETLINLPSQTRGNCVDYVKDSIKFCSSRYDLTDILIENRQYYAFLKEFGYNEIIEKFEYLSLFDPEKAMILLGNFGNLIVDPNQNSFKSDYVFSFESVTELDSCINRHDYIKNNKIHDIGKFLLNKLTFMPESFDACKDVIDRYKQEDLYTVSASLRKGIYESDIDLVDKEKIELSDILENVWTDATLEKRITGLRYGIPISMALVGNLAIGGVGLLAGLGITGISEMIAVDQESTGEKIAKKTVPDYLVNIFDFKKKYNIEKQ
jgi:hypothetical protein